MNTAVFLTTVITLGVFMLGTVLTVVNGFSHRLDRLDDGMQEVRDRLTTLEVKWGER